MSVHNFALLGTSVNGLFPLGNKPVTVEDTACGDHHYTALDGGGTRYFGVVADGVFTPKVDNSYGSKPTPIAKPVVKAPIEVTQELPLVYVEELNCGGCGAPMGISRVSASTFERTKGQVYTNFVDYNDYEVSTSLCEARDNGLMRLRYVDRRCYGCREI